MNETEKRMYNKYIQGKITLSELLEWHETYKKREDIKAC